jgi:colanic acid/amylovoran biosynthesis protein
MAQTYERRVAAEDNGAFRGGPWRILIVDNVVSNAGDAAIVIAMNRSLKRVFGDDAEVLSCFCGATADPGIYGEFYPELHFVRTLWHCEYDWSIDKSNLWARIVRLTSASRFVLQARAHRLGLPAPFLFPNERKLFRTFLDSDVIVVTGGAPLCTSWTPKSIRRHRVAQYRAARVLGKPLVFYSQSFGPFAPGDKLPRMLAPEVRAAAVVLCRDAPSLDTVREVLGVDTPALHLTIDEALLLEPRPPSRALAPKARSALRIGVCVHQWNWLGEPDPASKQREFESRIAAVCSRLLSEHDCEVVLITTHQRIPGAMHTDEEVSERVAAAIPLDRQDRVRIVQGFVHPQEFAGFMGQCDVVLSSRLHGAILSLVGGAPTIALEYEPKTRGLMRQLGLEDWVLSMGDSTAGEIYAALAAIIGNLDCAATRRREGVAKGRDLAQNSAEYVCSAVMDFRQAKSRSK